MNIQIKTNILGCAVGTISVSCILNYYYKLLIDIFIPDSHKIQKHKIPQPQQTINKTPKNPTQQQSATQKHTNKQN